MDHQKGGTLVEGTCCWNNSCFVCTSIEERKGKERFLMARIKIAVKRLDAQDKGCKLHKTEK